MSKKEIEELKKQDDGRILSLMIFNNGNIKGILNTYPYKCNSFSEEQLINLDKSHLIPQAKSDFPSKKIRYWFVTKNKS